MFSGIWLLLTLVVYVFPLFTSGNFGLDDSFYLQDICDRIAFFMLSLYILKDCKLTDDSFKNIATWFVSVLLLVASLLFMVNYFTGNTPMDETGVYHIKE